MATGFATQFATSAQAQLQAMFGETVLYKVNNAGAGTNITARWRPAGVDVRYDDDGEYEVGVGTLVCDASDVASRDVDDTFTISSVVWAVESYDARGDSIVATLITHDPRFLGGTKTRID